MKRKSSYLFLLFVVVLFTKNCLIAQALVNPIPDELQLQKTIENYQISHINSVTNNAVNFTWHDPITKLPEDIFKFGGQVFNVNSIPTIAGLAALTGALISIDHITSEPFYKNYRSSSSSRNLSKKISFLGGGEFHLIVATIFGGAGLIFKNNRAKRTALQIVEAELACGLTVQLLKRISGRESPQSATSPRGTFRPFPNWNEYARHETKFYSFPSGHLSTSMAVLTVIADNYPEISWIKPVGYSTLGIIGIGLVARGWHWFSDFPLAIAIGYTYGKLITGRNLSNSENSQTGSQLSIFPTYINGPGLSLNYSF